MSIPAMFSSDLPIVSILITPVSCMTFGLQTKPEVEHPPSRMLSINEMSVAAILSSDLPILSNHITLVSCMTFGLQTMPEVEHPPSKMLSINDHLGPCQ